MECQVQLAQKSKDEQFQNGMYSRKFDGKRMYILYGNALSRANKLCREFPIQHIIEEINSVVNPRYSDLVTDGEVIYFDDDFKEDFKKTISLTSRIDRSVDCGNLYYVIFDLIDAGKFTTKTPDVAFWESYAQLLELFEAVPFREDLYKTKYPHILIAKQTTDMTELTNSKNFLEWEGLMYRNANAPYEYKRSKNLLKIKKMQDTECKVIGFKEGIGRHEGRLGAVLVDYKGHTVAVGSGFTDEDRDNIWAIQEELIQKDFYLKIRYFEESSNAKGELSLRFPTYICFRTYDSEEHV